MNSITPKPEIDARATSRNAPELDTAAPQPEASWESLPLDIIGRLPLDAASLANLAQTRKELRSMPQAPGAKTRAWRTTAGTSTEAAVLQRAFGQLSKVPDPGNLPALLGLATLSRQLDDGGSEALAEQALQHVYARLPGAPPEEQAVMQATLRTIAQEKPEGAAAKALQALPHYLNLDSLIEQATLGDVMPAGLLDLADSPLYSPELAHAFAELSREAVSAEVKTVAYSAMVSIAKNGGEDDTALQLLITTANVGGHNTPAAHLAAVLLRGQSQQPGAVFALHTMAQEGNSMAFIKLSELMLMQPPHPDAYGHMLSLLDQPAHAPLAAYLLGSVATPDLADRLASVALHHGTSDAARGGFDALIARWPDDSRCHEALLRVARHDEWDGPACTVALLERLDNPALADAYASEALKGYAPDDVQSRALTNLLAQAQKYPQDARCHNALMRLMQDGGSDDTLRKKAGHLLASLGSPDVAGVLADVLVDWANNAPASSALCDVVARHPSDPRCHAALEKLATCESWMARREAARIMSRMAHPATADLLRLMASDDVNNYFYKNIAAEGLRQIALKQKSK